MTAMPDALLQPFTASVWQCLAVSWLLLTVTFRFIAVSKRRRAQDVAAEVDKSWSNAFVVTIGIIAEQGQLLNFCLFNDAISNHAYVPSNGR